MALLEGEACADAERFYEQQLLPHVLELLTPTTRGTGDEEGGEDGGRDQGEEGEEGEEGRAISGGLHTQWLAQEARLCRRNDQKEEGADAKGNADAADAADAAVAAVAADENEDETGIDISNENENTGTRTTTTTTRTSPSRKQVVQIWQGIQQQVGG